MLAMAVNTVMVKWLLLSLFVSFAAGETYYVTPSLDIPCPQKGVPCDTLYHYAIKPDGYFDDFTILIMLPGNHSLKTSISFRGIKDVTIVAPSPHLTSIYNEVVCAFLFQDIQSVLISGMNLTEGCSFSVYSVQQFTLEGSYLRGIVNQTTPGQALRLSSVEKAVISKVRFTSFVNLQDSVFTAGSAMYTEYSSVMITESTFEANKANQGGAVLFNEQSTVHIKNCTFSGNEAVPLGCNGGAINVAAENTTVVIEKSYFYNNLACHSGAITTPNNANVTISDTVFDQNEASDQDAGAVYLNGRCQIKNCTFSNNKARHGGGGIMIQSDKSNQAMITGSTFISNSAQVGGAGYFNTITIRDCVFKDNKAVHNFDTGRGGAITHQLKGLFIAVYNSTFDGNTAEYGGAMHLNVTDTYLSGCVFTNNYAQKGASAIAFDQADHATVNITNIEFYNNHGRVPVVAFSSFHNQHLDVYVNGYLIMRDNSGDGLWTAGHYHTHINGQTNVISNTGGGFSVTDGSLTFNGTTEFRDNSFIPSNGTNATADVFCRNGQVNFQGTTKILYNPGAYGGPIRSVDCTVSMAGDLSIQSSETVPSSKDTENNKQGTEGELLLRKAIKVAISDCKVCGKAL